MARSLENTFGQPLTAEEMKGLEDQGYSWQGGDPSNPYNKGTFALHPAGPPTPEWADITQPGLAETTAQDAIPNVLDSNTLGKMWAESNASAFTNQGNMEQFWNGVAGNFSNRPGASNNAQTAYDEYEQGRPELESNLDPYFDRQRQKTTNEIDRALMARGAFNSSRGIQSISDAMVDLGAEQALKEGDWDIARDKSAQTWAQGRSNAARGADVSSLGAATLDMNQLLGYGELADSAQRARENRLLTDLGVAMGLDAQELSRLTTAVNMGSVGQSARENRIGMGFDAISGVGGAASDIVGEGGDKIITALMEIEEMINSGDIAGAQAAMQKLQMDRSNIQGETAAVADLGGEIIPAI